MAKDEKEWLEATAGDVIKLEPGERIDGIFLGMEESATFKESWAVKLKVEGENKVIFGNAILKELIEQNQIQVNQEISILYVEKKKNEKGTFEYKVYKLFYKEMK